jgi:Zn-dependent protease
MLEALVFNIVTTLGPLILAIAVHEWAHIAMARFLGDPTGTSMGRFTLNPVAHIDPIWTVAVPVFFIVSQTIAGSGFAVPFLAAGKPAPYNPVKLDRRFGGKRIPMGLGELLVAAAGPVSNLVLALLTTVAILAIMRTGQPLDLFEAPRALPALLFKFVVLNISLFLFNLIPVPPLDGNKILFNALPRSIGLRYQEAVEKVGSLLLLVILLGGARFLLAPVQGAIVSVLWGFLQRFG